MSDKKQRIVSLAREKGIVRPGDLGAIDVSPSYLTRLVESGDMVRTGKGLYRLPDHDATEAHGLVQAARAQSRGVVCLLSALAFHGLGTQLPHETWIAVPYGARIAKGHGAPLRVVVMRPPSYGEGIEIHRLEGLDVPIYGVAKTVADCFKFRRRVGLDVALEALREALRDRRCEREEIRRFAGIDRVERVMRPYMEALAA